MTEEEEKTAFEQWVNDWGDNFPNMPKDTLWFVFRSMDEQNRKEFFKKAKGVCKDD